MNGCFWADFPNRTGYRPEHQHGPDRNTVWLGQSVQKYPWVPKNVLSWVPDAGPPNMKLPNRFPAGTSARPGPKHCLARSIPPKISMGTKECVELGSGYGSSEYEVSFRLAPRNGDLSPSDPQTHEPLNSPFRPRNPEWTSDSNLSQNVGSAGQNLGSRGVHTQR